jgi:YrbI family 3-deoxy-D-manno-octulosonate 8-phosphate phosphatase
MSAQSPSVIAIIPARGGSERIPGKNLLPLAGIPIVAHSILHAKRATCVQEVIVSTEDTHIAEVAREYGAKVISRPEELAGAEATSESALLHVLDERKRQGKEDPDLVVFLQCTSPVRQADDIDRAVQQLLDEEADSLFSACRNYALIWHKTPNGPDALTYDYHTRKREQEMEEQYRENGSLYVTKTELLRKTGNRLCGKITVFLMDEMHSFQVDTLKQVDLLRWVIRRDDTDWPKDTELVVFDFDGVMTDNRVRVAPDGDEAVHCNRRDGLGIDKLREAGIPMIVLSTEKHPVVKERCTKLRLPCFQGMGNKEKFLKEYLKKEMIDPKRVAYLGNDTNDLECLHMVGFPVVVADADPSVLGAARIVLATPGGQGAVREFSDKLLAARRG